MRPLEMLTVSLLLLAWVSRLLPSNKFPRGSLYLVGLAGLAALLQLVVEPYRWQMLPTYTLIALLFGRRLVRATRPRGPAAPVSWWRRLLQFLTLGLGLGGIALAAGLLSLFPMPQYPSPTGPYPVGITTFSLIDETRAETFTTAPEDKRLVYLEVWYPAQATAQGERFSPIPPAVNAVFGPAFGVPDFTFSHLTSIRSHSLPNAPLADAPTPFPVLVFSHGYYTGFPSQNTVQMEELASHGYIIFSIGHPYQSTHVVDPQGQLVTLLTLPQPVTAAEGQSTQTMLHAITSTTGTAQIQAARDFLAYDPKMQESLQVWAQDTQFAMMQIELIHQGQVNSPFAGRLDLARLGVFGMSFGGATAFQVCAVDTRCRAAVNMDGFQYGTLLENRLQAPFLMMYSEGNNRMNDWALANSPATGYRLAVSGTTHFNYMDANLILPSIMLGKIKADRIEHLMNTYLLAFFDQTLKGQPSALLQAGNSANPEVTVEVLPGTLR